MRPLEVKTVTENFDLGNQHHHQRDHDDGGGRAEVLVAVGDAHGVDPGGAGGVCMKS